MNIYFFPVNLNYWPMFDKVKMVGHIEPFPSNKNMKKGDFAVLYVGEQLKSVASGVYAWGTIVSDPYILRNAPKDLSNNKSVVDVMINYISYTTPIINKTQASSIFKQRQSRHQLNDESSAKIRKYISFEDNTITNQPDNKDFEKELQSLNIDLNKVVFIDLTWMKNYDGDEPYSHGSGDYAKDNAPHEMFNFQKRGNFYYGYTNPHGKLEISNISTDIHKDEFGEYIDNVLIVFTSPPKKLKGRAIIGWYIDAKAYKEPLVTNGIERYMKRINEFSKYNLICKYENGKLLDEEERRYTIPHARTEKDGFGESQVYYARGENGKKIKENAIKYIVECINDNKKTYFDDEKKYTEGGESKYTVKLNKRNREAREKCLEIHGYKCNICNFDFLESYGEVGRDFIEVHHIESITKTSGVEYEIDPKKDLIPVCSNCHSMLHRKRPAYYPKDIKAILETQLVKK